MTIGTITSAGVGETFWVKDRIVPILMWGREGAGFHSRVHVANYYSLLKPDEAVAGTVLLDLISSNGDLVASEKFDLGPEEHVQVEVGSLLADFEGTIAVRLVPRAELAHPHRYLGTLYFVSWHDDDGHIQFSHELNRMTFDVENPVRTYFSPGIFLRPELAVNVILQSSYFGDEPLPAEQISMALVDVDGKDLATASVSMPARTSKVVALTDLFQGAAERARGTVAIRIRAARLNHPMTYISHANGDFNIHHF